VLDTPIRRLRLVGLFEGLSFLALIFIAVPIKRIEALGANPEPVRIIGSIHGGLFLLYLAVALLAALRPGLPGRLLPLTLAAAFVPFGPFLIDGKLKRHDAR